MKPHIEAAFEQWVRSVEDDSDYDPSPADGFEAGMLAGLAAGRKLADACRALIEEFRTPEIMGKIAPTGSKLDRQRQALTIGEESLAEWNKLTEGKP